jgi:hypothetical protein
MCPVDARWAESKSFPDIALESLGKAVNAPIHARICRQSVAGPAAKP